MPEQKLLPIRESALNTARPAEHTFSDEGWKGRKRNTKKKERLKTKKRRRKKGRGENMENRTRKRKCKKEA